MSTASDTLEPPEEPIGSPAIAGRVALVLSFCVQATVSLYIIYGPNRPRLDVSDYGFYTSKPEYEISIYLAAWALTILVISASILWWSGRVRASSASGGVDASNRTTILLFTVALMSALLFFGFVRPVSHISIFQKYGGWTYPLFVLALPMLIAVASILVHLRPKRRSDSSLIDFAIDCSIPFVLVGLILVPDWRTITGYIYQSDNFFHIDAFVMDPALRLVKGGAFGSGVYSQYGLGWPTFFANSASVLSLSYGRFVLFCMIFSCVYLYGFYFLLRRLTLSAPIALLGTLLVVNLALFARGDWENFIIWTYPQSHFIRRPLDILILFSIWAHLRGGKSRWAVLASAAAGASLFFVTDTGLFLAATLFFYFGVRFTCSKMFMDGSNRRENALHYVAFAAIYAATFLSGAAWASQMSLFSGTFWGQWMTGILESGGPRGYGSSPFRTSSVQAVWTYAIVFSIYVVTLARFFVSVVRSRVRITQVFLATTAVYGSASLVFFVGRSQLDVLYQNIVPAVVIAAVYAQGALPVSADWLARLDFGPRFKQLAAATPFLIPVALILVTGVQMTHHMKEQTYANAYSFLTGLEYDEILEASAGRTLQKFGQDCMFHLPLDCCGRSHEQTSAFRDTAKMFRALGATGESVAIVSTHATTYYLASGLSPWSSPAPLVSLLTKQDVVEYASELLRQHPGYVIIPRQGEGPMWDNWFPATLKTVRTAISPKYTLVDTLQGFEIWKYGGIG